MNAAALLDVAPLSKDRAQLWLGTRGYVATGDADDSGNLVATAISHAERPTRADLSARPGDVVMARMAGTQKIFVVDENSASYVFSTGFAILRPDTTRVDSHYLKHWLRTHQFQSAKDRHSAGATQRAITDAGLRKLTVPLPDIRVQRQVTTILDRAEAVRSKRQQILAYIDGLEKACFVRMFGDPIQDSNKLATRKLASLGRLDRGVSKHRPRNDPALLGGPYPLVQTGDVANSGGYIRTFKSTYSNFGVAQSRIWPAGTLCITIAANIAKTGILTFDACFPDSVVGFSADDDTVAYVRVWLGFLQATLEAAAPQSAQKNINLAVLRDLDVPMPGQESLAVFARQVGQIRTLSEAQRRAAAMDDELFASLQSRAFRGEL